MSTRLHLDDIIYQLQSTGGISVYWREVTSRIEKQLEFAVQRTAGSRWARLLPVVSNADIFHSSYFRLALSWKTRNVVTIYDLAYERGLVHTVGSMVNIAQRRWAILAADAIICISEFTRDELLACYPQLSGRPNIHVVWLGTSSYADPPLDVTVSARLAGLGARLRRGILCVGARGHRKNFRVALLGFHGSKLPAMGYSLICTGAPFTTEETEQIRKLNLRDHVVVIDRATRDEMRCLYQYAFALVYPSLYEGFGLPPLEAMGSGCPVIVSRAASLPEIVGNAGILVDPKNPQEISLALENLLNEEMRRDYIARGLERAKQFTWDAAAAKTADVYKSLN